MAETLYKWLRANGEAPHGSGKWVPNRWRAVRGELVPCQNGLHLCRERDLPYWICEALWVVELEPGVERVDVNEGESKVVVRSARIVERLAAWNETAARLFAADCAERVLPLFEREHPGDDRPRNAIEATRAFARGEIDAAASDAARAAASDAAWAAARAAARDAARAAASDAAWAAARAAARDAASDAASDAAVAAARDAASDAASDAAVDAASDAAVDAAWAAAWAAARAAERLWQSARILAYATGEMR